MTDNDSIYARLPLRTIGDIACYSNFDRYVLNYMRIAYDHVSSLKDENSNPFMPDSLFLGMHAVTKSLIEGYARSDNLILDIGVGLGHLVGPLKHCKRYGVDISFDYLEIARAQGIDAVFCRAEDLPYNDSVFDLIVATDVLEHVLDISEVTRSVTRVLKSGGYLVIRVPLEEDLTPYLSADSPYEFVHLRAFSESGLRLHFEKCFGFEHVETRFSVPFLQGHSRLKAKFLPENDRQSLANLNHVSDLSPVLELLQKTSLEQLEAEIYRIQREYPDIYSTLEHLIIKPIEVNCVFRKL